MGRSAQAIGQSSEVLPTAGCGQLFVRAFECVTSNHLLVFVGLAAFVGHSKSLRGLIDGVRCVLRGVSALCLPFPRALAGGKTPDVGSRTYTQIMREQMLKGEESEVRINNSAINYTCV